MEMAGEMERPVSDVIATTNTRYKDSEAPSDERPNTTKSRVLATSALSQPRLSRTPATSKRVHAVQEHDDDDINVQSRTLEHGSDVADGAPPSHVSTESFLITELRDQAGQAVDREWGALEYGRQDTALSTPLLTSRPVDDEESRNDEDDYDTDLDIEGRCLSGGVRLEGRCVRGCETRR